MPEGIIILAQGHSITALGCFLIIIGASAGIILLFTIFAAWEDMEFWHKIVTPIASVIFIVMAIIGANMRDEIMKVAVLNNSSLPALVENYEVIKTDGLIFTVKEREKEMISEEIVLDPEHSELDAFVDDILKAVNDECYKYTKLEKIEFSGESLSKLIDVLKYFKYRVFAERWNDK